MDKWRMRRRLRKIQKNDRDMALLMWDMGRRLDVDGPPPMLVHLLERTRRRLPRATALLDKAVERL